MRKTAVLANDVVPRTKNGELQRGENVMAAETL
jgi:hypothetical protein